MILTVMAFGDTLAAERPNVLFIAVDDLRPELTSFGTDHMVTPHFDRLAKRGVRFDRAYCMVPTCGASRASLMTGIRPANDRFLTFTARADQDAPGVTTINTHFRNHGYRTISLGKVFHHPADNRSGWSEPPERPNAKRYVTESSLAATVQDAKGRSRGPSWENGGDVPDDTYTDGVIGNQAVDRLRELASRPDEPFFFAVGFTKPHLPFVAPGRYYEKYPTAEVRLPSNYFPPKAAPEGAVHNSGELRGYSDIPKTGVISEDKARELIRGYHAATSYTDAHLGRLLDVFDELGLAKNTIVVLWGDHGWNLGEHTMWCKHSCFETSLRAPLVVVTPDSMDLTSGTSTPSLVEFIDIYPTLCELADLPLPDHLDGDSLVPILKDPAISIKEQAISRFKDGDSIRTDHFRYTVYRNNDGQVTGHMLYDHRNDPGENVNVADEANYADLVVTLGRQLQSKMGKPGDVASQKRVATVTSVEANLLKELDIKEDQKQAFLSIQRSMTAKWAEFQKMAPELRKQKQQTFYRARNEELEKILTPEQMAKFREIRGRRNRQRPTSGPSATTNDRQRGKTERASRPDYSGNDTEGIETIVDVLDRVEEPWRKQAEQRIDRLRKADLEIRVVDDAGKPIAGIPVRVQLQRHAFRFGGIVGGPSMHEPSPQQRSRPISPDQYKTLFLELGVNASGFHSYLKYKRFEQASPHLPDLFDWFQQHEIPVRGHCLIWPGGDHKNFMPAKLSEMVYVPN
ncbi:MAG: sulfatase-like hydrolase/transferase, partial [Planctomycetota bacterium]